MTEIICAVGGSEFLVGRTSACDYPPEVVKKTPVIGGFGAPSLEMLLATRPSLILDVALEDEIVGKKLEDLGMNRVRILCRNLDNIPDAMQEVARLIQTESSAAPQIEALRKKIAALRLQAKSVTHRPSVYVEIWHDPLTTAGRGTFLSELIHLAGGRNIGDEVDKEYFQVSPEWILNKNPDIIFCFYMSNDSRAKNLVLNRIGWQSISAVRNGRIYDGFDNNIILRPGPRVLQGIAALRACIQTDVQK